MGKRDPGQPGEDEEQKAADILRRLNEYKDRTDEEIIDEFLRRLDERAEELRREERERKR